MVSQLPCSFMKVGCAVFLVHDVNDIFMEAAKMARYAGKQTLCTVLFVTFMLSWFASRIYYLPAYIIRSCLTEPITVSGAADFSTFAAQHLILPVLQCATCLTPGPASERPSGPNFMSVHILLSGTC